MKLQQGITGFDAKPIFEQLELMDVLTKIPV